MADGFDVLEAMDGLKSAGFSEAQSRALADSFQSVAAARSQDLVTKSDLRAEIEALRSELIKLMADQQRWTVGILIAVIGAATAVIKLL